MVRLLSDLEAKAHADAVTTDLDVICLRLIIYRACILIEGDFVPFSMSCHFEPHPSSHTDYSHRERLRYFRTLALKQNEVPDTLSPWTCDFRT